MLYMVSVNAAKSSRSAIPSSSSLKTDVNIQLLDYQPLTLSLLNHDPRIIHRPYFLIDEALRLRSSDFLVFSSLTRLARIDAYSFCSIVLVSKHCSFKS